MSEPLRVLLVDDEPLARTLLRALIEKERDVQIAGECSGGEAAAAIARARPDLVFLDVQMPDVDGFQVLEQVGPERMPAVVFVTAYDRHALRAFAVHAVDYLLKPVDAARFHAALEHARARALRPADVAAAPGIAALLEARARYPSRILVPGREGTIVVDVDGIDRIEAADYYVSIHAGGRTHLLRETMAEFEKRLDPARFFRVHRSAIVNLDRVREIRPLFHGDAELILSGGDKVRLSRTRRADFARLFRTDRPSS
ncbi:MAG TPA: LytTR family DNA-binding domain-containing protein [Dongiaceae bacterium]|nr:LytTR family DNA-binding domain-containing protein [Dongiaceae bacterium]